MLCSWYQTAQTLSHLWSRSSDEWMGEPFVTTPQLLPTGRSHHVYVQLPEHFTLCHLLSKSPIIYSKVEWNIPLQTPSFSCCGFLLCYLGIPVSPFYWCNTNLSSLLKTGRIVGVPCLLVGRETEAPNAFFGGFLAARNDKTLSLVITFYMMWFCAWCFLPMWIITHVNHLPLKKKVEICPFQNTLDDFCLLDSTCGQKYMSSL